MHFDLDPTERAYRQAVAAMAEAKQGGTKEQVTAARRQLDAAIAAFPEDRREAISAMTGQRVNAQSKRLQADQERTADSSEAAELQAALERWEQENRLSLKR